MLKAIFYILTGIAFIGAAAAGIKRQSGPTLDSSEKKKDSDLQKRTIFFLIAAVVFFILAQIMPGQ